MVRELQDELLADHAGRPENPHVHAFHSRLPQNKNAGLIVLAGVSVVRSDELAHHVRTHHTGLPDRLVRFRMEAGLIARVMIRCSIATERRGGQGWNEPSQCVIAYIITLIPTA